PKPPSEFARLPAGIGKAVESHRFSPSLDTESTEQPGRLAVYTTNMATPAANIATVVIATTVHPKRELGWPCISLLSEAMTRIATRRNGANNPLMTAVQSNAFTGLMPTKSSPTPTAVERKMRV